MAVIKAVSSKASIGQAIDYVIKAEKTEKKLVSGLRCELETAKEEMQATKELWGKTDGRTYKHFVQSYHEGEAITPEQAHRNAIELAEHTLAWNGFEVLIATHKDKEHIHTHFIVNSVNYEDGHKLQWSKHDLQDLKDRCNEQSRQQGLHVAERGKTFEGQDREETVAWSKDTYQLLKKAEHGEVKSYVQDIALAVMDCRETAGSREDFIQKMKERGYGVDWQENHKYITFIDLARADRGEKQYKIRNNKLEKYYNMDFGKEELERGFEVNTRSTEAEQQAREQLNRTSRRAEQPDSRTGRNETAALIGEARACIDAAGANEENSRAIRANREAERQRLSAARKRRAEEAKREAKARSLSRERTSRFRGYESDEANIDM